MKYSFSIHLVAALVACLALGAPTFGSPAVSGSPVWKTAFYKRGFVGDFRAEWAGGIGSTTRLRVPMPLSGSKFRISVNGMWDQATTIAKLCLAPSSGDGSTLTGPPTTALFAGQPSVSLAPHQPPITSDDIATKIDGRVMCLEYVSGSEYYPYAYAVDKVFVEVGEHTGDATLTKSNAGQWPCPAFRIDVLTDDKRPLIACYGDSITAGYLSTPGVGHSYPAQLSGLLNEPVLNLGVNGDTMRQSGDGSRLIAGLNGVDIVVELLGVNDLLTGGITTLDQYQAVAKRAITGYRLAGKNVFWGTVMPFGAFAKAPTTPAAEKLREDINDWIRTSSGADGVIDFDKATRDQCDTTKLRADLESDGLHPNDAGYMAMAQEAARILR